MRRKNDTRAAQVLYCLLFYSLWSVWEFWGKGTVERAIENEWLAQLVKSGLVKNLVWTLPALCLAKHFDDALFFRVRDMFTNPVSVWTWLPAALAFSVYLIGGAWLMNGRLAFSESFRASDLIVVLFVGVTEETVFRGWLLNASVRESKKWPPVLLNALLFLLIHFPAWIAGGSFAVNFSSLGFVCLLALSLVFSWSFLKSKSLWVPIALHMYWDLLCFLLY